jgi:hypothetical protein
MSKQETTPAKARRLAEVDATLYGAGFLMLRPDGTAERIDPTRVVIKPESKPDAE